MIAVGLRLRDLGSDRFTWSDLRAIINNLSRSSALARKMDPERAAWGPAEYMAAMQTDALNWLVWSKTKDGAKNRKRPKPVPRPGDKDNAKGRFKDAVALPIDEVQRMLALPRRRSGR